MSRTDALRALRPKILNDPIHGLIEIPRYCLEIIDTPQFQRLRSLKQLGVTSYVYPSSTHTRFEHSIGVSHLANKSIVRFQQDEPALHISDEEVQLVTVAGLCHDLGHGPFSHAFEGWIKSLPGCEKWHHEDRSIDLLQSIIDEGYCSFEYERDQIRKIGDMIRGIKAKDRANTPRGFLYEIVANKRNNVDVDKLDYLARDSYHCGLPVPNFGRLLVKRRILDDQICYHVKESFNLSEMFRKRFSMFRTVYMHEVGISIEHMLRDILTAANEPLSIAERAKNPSDFMVLTDAILNEVECSKHPELSAAKKLLRRLRTRQLYTVVGKVRILDDHVKKFKAAQKDGSHRSQMIRFCDPGAGVTEADVEIHLSEMTFGQGFDDPLKHVKFYQTLDPDEEPQTLTDRDISALHPVNFSENVALCISKDKDKAKAISKGWQKYCNSVVKREYPGARTENSPHMRRAFSLPVTPQSVHRSAEAASRGGGGEDVPAKKARLFTGE